MAIEILSIGDEILSGSIQDTNFPYLADALKKAGYLVSFHQTVSDEPEILEKAIKNALARSQLVITTGGLGPTLDDRTKEITAKVFEKNLTTSEEIKSILTKRYSGKLSSIENQSIVPEGTELLYNDIGTAPGFFYRKGNKALVVLPGVPHEMKAMFETYALKKIIELLTDRKKIFFKHMHFCHLGEDELDPYLREIEKRHPNVSTGIYPGYGILSVSLKVVGEEKKLDECAEFLLEKFPTHFYSYEQKDLAYALQKEMIAKNLTLALAESCTGGHIAAKITNIADCSKYFLGSMVSYSDEMKKRALLVASSHLEKFGAVSKEVVEDMLLGAEKLTSADFVLAVSGIAGPGGGTKEKPIGTVYCGILKKGSKPHVGKILSKGRTKRELVIEYVSNFMLGSLYRKIMYDVNSF